MKMDAYVVNWKDTTLNEDNVLETETGTCEVAYKEEHNAQSKLEELVKSQKEECIDELGYDEDDVEITIEDGYGCVTAGSNTYEFTIEGIDIM